VNTTQQTGYLYDGDQIVAQLNGSNQIASQFVYATGATSADYMVNGGATYRIISDQLGSPRLVVNTSTGAIAEQMNYDEFGNVLTDSNAGFQPFGFAGGLKDPDTGFVRFGARDYNPATGRWTAKDPILFVGGDSNLYGYATTDPVNLVDPAGLQAQDCVCKEKQGWDSLGESVAQFSGPMDMLKTAVANIFGQIGATVGEIPTGYLRIADLVSGGKLLAGSHSLQVETLWEKTQKGFNTAYDQEIDELYGGKCQRQQAKQEKEKRELQKWLDSLSQPTRGRYDPQQGNPGYAQP
jgi:RHS repeat-associated protein